MKLKALILLLIIPFLSFSSPDISVKQIEVEKIVKNMVNAIGDFRKPVPVVKLQPGKSTKVAYIYKDNVSNQYLIMVDEVLYDLCMEYGDQGDDALAAILGHELAHYYNDHHFSDNFVSFFGFSETGDKIEQADKTMESLTVYETQADYYGGMYGFMAGYNTFGMIPQLYEKIYKAYSLPDQTANYPSKDERKQIAVKNGEKIKNLSYVFQVGTYCMLINKYDEAIKCFDYIINDGFITRDILNNLGVAYALRAMQLKGRTIEEPYAYPFELDAQSRLKAGTKGVTDDPTALLNLAKDNFEKAALLDPDYATAEVNLACVWSVLGDLDEADYHATKATKKSNKTDDQQQSLKNAYVVQAIIAKKKGETDEANELLAQAGDNYFAQINKEIFDGEVVNWSIPKSTPNLPPSATIIDYEGKLKRESIENVNVDDQTTYPTVVNDSIEFNIGPTKQNMPDFREIKIMNLDFSKIFFMEVPDMMVKTRSNWLIFQETNENYAFTTSNNLKLGDDYATVEAIYGSPVNMTSARQGTYLYYSDSAIVIRLDSENKVAGWILYWERSQ